MTRGGAADGAAGARGAKLRVGILAGGASAERDISLASGSQIAAALPADRYEVVILDPLALMARNPALSAERREQARALATGGGRIDPPRALPKGLEADIERASGALVPATTLSSDAHGIDVVLIALFGAYGEDGRMQGMLDLLGIPYTGSGVLASALAMDKVMAKAVLSQHGLDVPKGVVVTSPDDPVARSVPPPVFVKPVAQGSSIGAGVVERAERLRDAIAEALRHDDRVLVEELVRGTELTCAVIGNDETVALPVIEIVTSHAFFDYGAKYDSGESEEIVPARIDPALAHRVQEAALVAHRALGCRGMSRTDFIASGDRLVTLEVNTIPGMTANSLLPKAARAAGIGFGELCERLIRWALEDAARRAR